MTTHDTTNMGSNGGASSPTAGIAAARLVLLLAAPLSMGAAMGVGIVVLVGAGATAHSREMLAAGALNTVAGMLAMLPAVHMLRHGAGRLAMGALAATGIRMVVVLGGALLLPLPGWAMDRTWLLGFVVAFYLVVLLTESAGTTWVLRRTR